MKHIYRGMKAWHVYNMVIAWVNCHYFSAPINTLLAGTSSGGEILCVALFIYFTGLFSDYISSLFQCLEEMNVSTVCD